MEAAIQTRKGACGMEKPIRAIAVAFAAAMFALVMAITMPTAAWADDMSGDCSAAGDDSIKWSLVENDDVLYAAYDGEDSNGNNWTYSQDSPEGAIEVSGYTLKIEGSGAMHDYTRQGASAAPWDVKLLEQIVNDKRYADIDANLAKRGCDIVANPRIARIKMSEGITYIGAHAFRSTGISTITIPNSVNKIGDYALIRCANLTSISIAEGSNDQRPAVLCRRWCSVRELSNRRWTIRNCAAFLARF